MTKELMKQLLNVSKGIEPPDTVIRNGKIINVFTDEIEEGLAISIKNGWIVSIGNNEKISTPEGTTEVDAEGMYLCPGFIDAHTHLDSILSYSELVPYAVRGGTTTVITETAMVATACGIKATHSFIESTKGYPLRCYFVAAPLTPPFPKMESAVGLSLKEFNGLLKRDDFVGIGEGYWTGILDGDERVLKQASLALSLNKRIDGHSSGARKDKLVQYLLTGITSCHESVTLDEALEKLRLGLYIMIREGFIRKELKELSKLKDFNVDKKRLILVSDLFDPVMLIEDGYVDSVVRRAISYGFSPLDAIKMATINPADYHGLRFLGAIAPLRYADILFLKDVEKVSVEKVMCNGKIVYSEGRFTERIKPSSYPEEMKHTLALQKVNEDDFRIKARPSKNLVRVEELINETISKESLWEAPVKDGFLQNDISDDIAYAAVINRNDKKKMGKGFVKATGIKDGAVATTLIWDTCNVFVIGSNVEDMTKAVNRLIELQGGIVVSRAGEVIFEFPMPVYGLIAVDPIEKLRDKIKLLDQAMKAIGSSIKRPFLTVQTIPFTGLPLLRITDKGLANVKDKQLVPLFAE
ncbi:MAG: amidohydrolase family protein [Proteobacteria bacterium]|nr:amidohydrolase family protein [Pseudomonadota bacterium]